MRRLLVLAGLAVLTVAKPGTYRENEEFQYSRSSTDEGSKSGYYGAQRGNVGGNYEKAHNMDHLAQSQMSSAIKSVDGEIGDLSSMKTGSVYTAANTRGQYGHGYHDLSNLQGRNFQEGVSLEDGAAHSSIVAGNSGYGAHSAYTKDHSAFRSHNSRYGGHRTAGNSIQDDSLVAASHRNSDYRNNYGAYDEQSKAYGSDSAYQYTQASSQQSAQSAYGSSAKSRLTGSRPIHIVVRPGSTVQVPVAAETYDNSQTSSQYNHNAINSEAEVFNNAENRYYTKTTKPKHYESSYNYHKEWEKHDSVPAAVPLAVPTNAQYPVNSELYENIQSMDHAAKEQHESSVNEYSQHNANSQYRHNAGYGSRYQTKSLGTSYGQNGASMGDLNRLTDVSVSGQPKKYESSYSYHKSWERQGDPYVIQPASTDGQAAQRLTSALSSQNAYRSQYGTKSSHSSYHQNPVDCDC